MLKNKINKDNFLLVLFFALGFVFIVMLGVYISIGDKTPNITKNQKKYLNIEKNTSKIYEQNTSFRKLSLPLYGDNNLSKKDDNISQKLDKIQENNTSKDENITQYQVLAKIERYVNAKKHLKKHKKSTKRLKKPKLAIIIDDVAFSSDVKGIKAIPYKVTPSFLPPSPRHPDTPFLARKFSVYMVHLPLEAIKHSRPEARTLMSNESFARIDSWIQKLSKKFPRASFYNNHTGSKFTSNTQAMDKLFRSFILRDIRFLDSKTSGKTKARKIARRYAMPIMSRDIFLDNVLEERYIKKQIKKAIQIAKKKGYAIAICHPKGVTLRTLKKVKYMFSDVRLVYINEL